MCTQACINVISLCFAIVLLKHTNGVADDDDNVSSIVSFCARPNAWNFFVDICIQRWKTKNSKQHTLTHS